MALKTKGGYRPTYIKVVIILISSVLPLYLLSAGILLVNYGLIKREILHSKNQAIDFYSQSIFRTLENTQMQLYQLLDSTDMGYFTLLDKSDGAGSKDYSQKVELTSRIQEQLINCLIMNDYLNDITLVTEGKTIITSNSVYFGDIESRDFYYERFGSQSGNLFYDRENGSLHMLTCFPALSSLSGETPSAIVFTELAVDRIQEDIAKRCSILPQDGQVVLASLDDSWFIPQHEQDSSRIGELLTNLKQEPAPLRPISLSNGTMWNAASLSQTLGLSILLCLDRLPVETPFLTLVLFFIGVAILTAVIIRLDWILIKRVVAMPVNTLIEAFRHVEQNDYRVIDAVEDKGEFGYVYTQFNNLVNELQTKAAIAYEQELRVKEAEFKHLQVQINPHFIYNSMFTISRMVKDGNTKLAGQFADYLGNYFRYITRTGTALVPLSEELQHMQNYINIMSIRFSNRIQVYVTNTAENIHVLIPKLIIQPLVENAFEHGIKDVLIDAEIRIDIYPSAGEIIIRVEDNGGSMDEEKIRALLTHINQSVESRNMTGLANVHKRLKLTYGESNGLMLAVGKDMGLVCTITIPYDETQQTERQETPPETTET